MRFRFVVLSILFLAGCEPALLSGSKCRQIHLQVVVDSSYATTFQWKNNVASLIDAANSFYKPWLNCEFRIDTCYLASIPRDTNYYADEYIITKYPKNGSDIVMYFSKEPRQEYTLAGLTCLDYGYVFIHQMGWYDAQEPFKWSFIALTHELGHMFGAMHIYPGEKDTTFLMEPYLSDKRATKSGKIVSFVDPNFDQPNANIVYAMRNRPFKESGWNRGMWDSIKTCYYRQFTRYDNCDKINSDGALHFYKDPHFAVLDKYYFLATYASLCGMDSVACSYCDSLNIAADEIRRCNLARNNIVFTYLERSYGRNWPQMVFVQSQYLKMRIYLRAHKFARADKVVEDLSRYFEAYSIPELYLTKEKLFVLWLKDFYSNNNLF